MHARPCVHVALHFGVSVRAENSTAGTGPAPEDGGEGGSGWAEPNTGGTRRVYVNFHFIQRLAMQVPLLHVWPLVALWCLGT